MRWFICVHASTLCSRDRLDVSRETSRRSRVSTWSENMSSSRRYIGSAHVMHLVPFGSTHESAVVPCLTDALAGCALYRRRYLGLCSERVIRWKCPRYVITNYSASRHEICATEEVGMDHLQQGHACSGVDVFCLSAMPSQALLTRKIQINISL